MKQLMLSRTMFSAAMFGAIASFGALSVVGGDIRDDAVFHFDASDTSTMTIVSENGTNYVTRWNCVSGDRYATVLGNRPFLGTFNGMTVVDFGTFNNDPYDHPDGYGASMAWSEADRAIREVFMVYSDVAEENPGDPFFLGTCGSLTTVDFHRDGRRLFSSQWASPCIRDGLIQVNGVNRSADYELPEGFHLLHFRTTGGVSANAFGIDRAYRRGGQRLAEVLVFNRVLNDYESFLIEHLLASKWLPDIADDLGNIESLAAFHFDASDTNTMTIVSENGTNFVTRWNCVSNEQRYATAIDGSRPFLGTFNGKTVVDFGTFNNAPYEYLDGYGASMAWSESDRAIREVFMVYSDVAAENPGDPFFLGTCGSLTTVDFHRDGRRLFSSQWASPCIRDGLIQVNGVNRSADYELPEGFHLLHFRTTGYVSANAFATDRNGRRGGQRLAEVLVFDSMTLTDALADDLVLRLMDKWLRNVGECELEYLQTGQEMATLTERLYTVVACELGGLIIKRIFDNIGRKDDKDA